jgi:mRNA-degrading endonuclease toxin of MazEF toxin-antitoxin module
VLTAGPYWKHFPSVLFALATSEPQTAAWPHMVFVPAGEIFDKDSWIDCSNLYWLRKDPYLSNSEYKGQLDDDVMERVNDALQVGTGVEDGSQFLKTEL